MKLSRILLACLVATVGSTAYAAKFNLKMGHAVNTTDGQHAAAVKLADAGDAAAKNKALMDDIRLLGRLLGDDETLNAIKAGESRATIKARWTKASALFEEQRRAAFGQRCAMTEAIPA